MADDGGELLPDASFPHDEFIFQTIQQSGLEKSCLKLMGVSQGSL
jgi:hypothetical protein